MKNFDSKKEKEFVKNERRLTEKRNKPNFTQGQWFFFEPLIIKHPNKKTSLSYFAIHNINILLICLSAGLIDNYLVDLRVND